MRYSRVATLSVVAISLALGAAETSHAAAPAAAKPQIVDDKGDSLNGAGNDIISGSFATTGTTTVTKVRGKKVTTYKPKNLVITLTLAAPPSTSMPAKYEFDADIDGCGYIQTAFSPGALLGSGSIFTECGGTNGTLIASEPVITGNSLVFTVALSELPAEVKVGSAVSNFTAYTAYAEPVTGIIDTGFVGLAFDDAAGDVTWKLG